MSETMTDTAVLREAAEKATGFHDGNLVRYEHGGGRLAIIPVPGDGPRKLIADFYHEEDREFFVLCDPATILSLCDEIDRLRTEADVRVTAGMVSRAHAVYSQTVGGMLRGNPMRNALEAALSEASK